MIIKLNIATQKQIIKIFKKQLISNLYLFLLETV